METRRVILEDETHRATPVDIENLTIRKPEGKVISDDDLAEALEDLHKDPNKSKEWRLKDGLGEAEKQIEIQRLTKIGQAFESFVAKSFGTQDIGLESYIAFVNSSVTMGEALKTMKVDGQPLASYQQEAVMFGLLKATIDLYTPRPLNKPILPIQRVFNEAASWAKVGENLINKAVKPVQPATSTLTVPVTPALKI